MAEEIKRDHKIETRDEQKWFSYLKQKAIDLKYGNLELTIMIKAGKIVSFQSIKEIDSFNIHNVD
jgi:hypothetical protein